MQMPRASFHWSPIFRGCIHPIRGNPVHPSTPPTSSSYHPLCRSLLLPLLGPCERAPLVSLQRPFSVREQVGHGFCQQTRVRTIPTFAHEITRGLLDDAVAFDRRVVLKITFFIAHVQAWKLDFQEDSTIHVLGASSSSVVS